MITSPIIHCIINTQITDASLYREWWLIQVVRVKELRTCNCWAFNRTLTLPPPRDTHKKRQKACKIWTVDRKAILRASRALAASWVQTNWPIISCSSCHAYLPSMPLWTLSFWRGRDRLLRMRLKRAGPGLLRSLLPAGPSTALDF